MQIWMVWFSLYFFMINIMAAVNGTDSHTCTCIIEWHFVFLQQCNYTKQVWWVASDHYVANILSYIFCQILWSLVNIWPSYSQNNRVPFYGSQCIMWTRHVALLNKTKYESQCMQNIIELYRTSNSVNSICWSWYSIVNRKSIGPI